MKIEEVLEKLNTGREGLGKEEAGKRLEKYGYNQLEKKRRINALKILLNQFNSFLIWILIAAVIISYFLGETLQSLVIVAILILIALLGFRQEYKAEKIMEALNKLKVKYARVVREGKEEIIEAKYLVPGDIIVLEEGYKVPADARIIESNNLKIDEALLTGESTPVLKTNEKIKESNVVADQRNTCFSETIIVNGKGIGIVTATGKETEFGKISEYIQEIKTEKSPLEKQMGHLGKVLGITLVLIVAFISVAGFFLTEIPFTELLLIAVTLAVSAVPEGLPAVVTITLALGMQAMSRKNTLVRKISAVESLGKITVIGSDKTGTITKNELTVTDIYFERKNYGVEGRGFDTEGKFTFKEEEVNPLENKYFKMLLKDAVWNNNAQIGEEKEEFVGDPTEIALLITGKKAGMELKARKPEFELLFDSERKRMSKIFAVKGKNIAYCKGAPESVIENCKYIISENSETEKMSKKEKEELYGKVKEMSSKGLRVLGFAFKELEKGEKEIEEVENGMTFLGLMGMIDVPREEVKEAVELARKAGIKVKMITGDHLLTAKAIAKEIGLIDGEKSRAVEGKDIEEMTVKQLANEIKDITVFARVSPIHKVKIIEALEMNGEIIAMTGDGVNDAPALKSADIGVAVGSGTDITKEAGEMVIMDDNFATIVKAVEQGRIIYSNIKNFVRYLLSANFGELLIIGVAIFLFPDSPLPLIPAQILWINLVTDGLPAIALSREKGDKEVMERPPRKPKESILHGTFAFILIAAVLGMIAGLTAYFYGLNQGGMNETMARTMAFTALVFFQLVLVFNCRNERKTAFEISPTSNFYLVTAVAISILLQLIVIYVPVIQILFGTTGLGINEWIVIILVSCLALIVPYIERVYRKIAKIILKN